MKAGGLGPRKRRGLEKEAARRFDLKNGRGAIETRRATKAKNLDAPAAFHDPAEEKPQVTRISPSASAARHPLPHPSSTRHLNNKLGISIYKQRR
jgi:hypothetical protein